MVEAAGNSRQVFHAVGDVMRVGLENGSPLVLRQGPPLL